MESGQIEFFSQKWAGRDWEIWVGATPESSDLLTVELYVRLLISNGIYRLRKVYSLR